ncbi:MAG: NAD(P)(+) transhydrogenase (Re/Si-specific) subunit beta [Halobacteriovoraceae bacterium]|jgi:H+-translocating NAD(P) transhydrogenase subunit beta|nr:NAD(P)(+) transhydrogenase (Re/Si-specific) subunit beta [Halobacteriovoraceae bacterium]MBT5093073.1 NAD(P)(+) transhydrogenase (Re/Si-specific) subunit beta [Halobacteriovoraceae bacterium]
MNTSLIINLTYIFSAFLFILGLKKLGSPATARKGNLLSSVGMLTAILVTLISKDIVSFKWIMLGMGLGTIIGIAGARLISMTSMPEMVAVLNGFGGIASLFVGWAAYLGNPQLNTFSATTIIISILIGGITFTGSFIAWAKLKEVMTGKPIMFPGQQVVNSLIILGVIAASVLFIRDPNAGLHFLWIVIGVSFLLGVMVVIPIGGADMPVVISLLNSYSGIAACAAGFVMQNNLLIVAGSLVGASGIILTNIMCKAMNRSLSNVLFSGFGSGSSAGSEIEGEAKPINVEDTFMILEAASTVCVVPGYGMAVAQAQHTVRELAEQLEENGCEVKFAIHPVAGRMPGHMNVLLAEANVPYEQLFEMDDVNPIMESVDVCMVIGANDVVNPAAREDEKSPIYGMPVINVDKAQTVIVLKRSLGTGFAGIQNPLFFKDNTRMLLGDAKGSVQGLVAEFKN